MQADLGLFPANFGKSEKLLGLWPAPEWHRCSLSLLKINSTTLNVGRFGMTPGGVRSPVLLDRWIIRRAYARG